MKDLSDEILHFDTDEMIEVYEICKMNIADLKERINSNILKMGVIIKAIKTKEEILDNKAVIKFINDKITERAAKKSD